MADLFVLLIVLVGFVAIYVGYLIGYFVLSALQGPVCRLWRAFAPYEWQVWYQQRHLSLQYLKQMRARVLYFPNSGGDVSSSSSKRTTHVRPNVTNRLLEEGLIRIGFPQCECQQSLLGTTTTTLPNNSNSFASEQREWLEHKSNEEEEKASDVSDSDSIRVCIREDDPEQPVATIRIRYATRPHNYSFARSITV